VVCSFLFIISINRGVSTKLKWILLKIEMDFLETLYFGMKLAYSDITASGEQIILFDETV
jgi:hypothetical protein